MTCYASIGTLNPTQSLTSSQRTWWKVMHRDCGCLFVPRSRLLFGRCVFLRSGPMAWNALPADIPSSTTITEFKQKLKTYLFGLSYPDT